MFEFEFAVFKEKHEHKINQICDITRFSAVEYFGNRALCTIL